MLRVFMHFQRLHSRLRTIIAVFVAYLLDFKQFCLVHTLLDGRTGEESMLGILLFDAGGHSPATNQ